MTKTTRRVVSIVQASIGMHNKNNSIIEYVKMYRKLEINRPKTRRITGGVFTQASAWKGLQCACASRLRPQGALIIFGEQ